MTNTPAKKKSMAQTQFTTTYFFPGPISHTQEHKLMKTYCVSYIHCVMQVTGINIGNFIALVNELKN